MLKKIISSILAVAMLATVGTTVFANELIEEETHDIVVDDSKNPEYSPEANMDSILRGDMLLKAKYDWTISGITQYYQNAGDTWDDDIMQTCGKTIKNAGCCITAFAMAISALGYSDDPGVVNTKLGTAACPYDPSKVSNRYNGYIAAGPALTSGTSSQFKSFIVDKISWDTPVIVGFTPKSGTGITSTHFVLAYGYSGDTIYIYDPANQRDYTQLSDYMTNYNIYRAYTVLNSAR